MATQSYTSRRQAVEQSYSIFVIVLAPLLALFLQAYIALRHPAIEYLDLPLLIVIYAALSRRSPIVGAVAGTVIGLAQDALTALPLGIYGVSKTIVGYLAASVSMRLDVDAVGSRAILVFCFTLFNDALVYCVRRFLLNMAHAFLPLHEVIRATLNAIAAMLLFALLDLFRRSR